MSKPGTFFNYDPSNGQRIGEYEIASPTRVEEALRSSRRAFESWRERPFRQRVRALASLRRSIVDDTPRLVDIICRDTGKVRLEALMSDIYPTLDLIRYYEDNLESILGKDPRKSSAGFGSRAWVEYFPVGVVGVIAPWNYPFQLSMIPTVTALAAGNGVVLKPSEISPMVGDAIDELLGSVTDLPRGLVEVVHGPGEVGESLIAAGPDMIFFTGSVATGKRIMRSASENLTPLILELGGKDAFIVLDDANLERAAAGAVYASFANTGQLCVSAERIYVQESVVQRFVELVRKETARLRVDEGYDGDVGPLTHPEGAERVRQHIDDALDRGAEVAQVAGAGGGESSRSPESLPCVLTGVDHSMDVMTRETFGPIMPIMAFADDSEAVRLANDSDFGLNASVWSRDLERAGKVARQLRVGNVSVNDAVKNIGSPDLPFGGVKHSGFGRYHGPEGLKNFSHTRSVSVQSGRRSKEINWFPFTPETYEDLMKYIHLRFGAGSLRDKASEAWSLLQRFAQRGLR